MSYSKNGYNLRPLLADDWALLKQKRLEALQNEPGVFGGSLAEEAQRPDENWQDRLTRPGAAAYFGLFDGDQNCVGLTGVFKHKDIDNAAILVASYIDRAHRNRGLSSLFYQARIDWARQQGFEKIIVSHRDTNMASKAANQKFGFVHTHTEMKIWPDGGQGDNIFYELRL